MRARGLFRFSPKFIAVSNEQVPMTTRKCVSKNNGKHLQPIIFAERLKHDEMQHTILQTAVRFNLKRTHKPVC